MPKEVLIVAYVILCIIVGLMGRRKTIGFWGFFFFSVILTPIISLGILIIAKDRNAKLF